MNYGTNIGAWMGGGTPNIGPWQGALVLPPTIIVHPENSTGYTGNLVTFTVEAIGMPPITYQWYKNGILQVGETGSSYSFIITPDDDGAEVWCVVTSSGVSVTSNTATLTVVVNPLYITEDEYYTKVQPAKSEELVNVVEVQTQPLIPATSSEEIFKTSKKIVIAAGATYDLRAYYKSQPALLTGVSITLVDTVGSLSIISETYYAWGSEVQLVNSGGTEGETNVKIDGYPLKVTGEETITASDATSIARNGIQQYSYPKNNLIQSSDVAQDIADTLLASYSLLRKDITITWRGNPAIELADIMDLSEYKRGATEVRADFKIYKNTITYNGGLKETTEGRKISGWLSSS